MLFSRRLACHTPRAADHGSFRQRLHLRSADLSNRAPLALPLHSPLTGSHIYPCTVTGPFQDPTCQAILPRTSWINHKNACVSVSPPDSYPCFVAQRTDLMQRVSRKPSGLRPAQNTGFKQLQIQIDKIPSSSGTILAFFQQLLPPPPQWHHHSDILEKSTGQCILRLVCVFCFPSWCYETVL